MSVLKQAEEARLTLEEIQELVNLTLAIIPKLESKSKSLGGLNTLINNLSEAFRESNVGNTNTPIVDTDTDKINKSIKLLRSGSVKLKKLLELVSDIQKDA